LSAYAEPGRRWTARRPGAEAGVAISAYDNLPKQIYFYLVLLTENEQMYFSFF
jgi:hypothetical protein